MIFIFSRKLYFIWWSYLWNVKKSEQEYQEVGVLVFLLAFTQVLGAPPEIFGEYFQQDVKVEYEIKYINSIFDSKHHFTIRICELLIILDVNTCRQFICHRGKWLRLAFRSNLGGIFWTSTFKKTSNYIKTCRNQDYCNRSIIVIQRFIYLYWNCVVWFGK